MATNQHYLVKQLSITNTDIAVPRQRCPRSYLSSNIHCPVKIRICQERRPPLHLQDSIYDLHLRMILCKIQLLWKNIFVMKIPAVLLVLRGETLGGWSCRNWLNQCRWDRPGYSQPTLGPNCTHTIHCIFAHYKRGPIFDSEKEMMELQSTLNLA